MITSTIKSISSWKLLTILFISLVIAVRTLFATIPAMEKVASKTPILVLDMRVNGWNLKDAVDFLTELGPEGREIYKSVYSSYNPIPLDVLVPILAAFFFTILLSLLFNESLFVFLPSIACGFDLMENTIIERIIDSYPQVTGLENIAKLGGILTFLKAYTNYSIWVICLVGIGLKIKQQISRKSKK